MIYFISDLHFSHKNILKFERSRFETIEEQNLFIIESLNSQVKKTDTLYILGDVGEPDWLKFLNGRKILIKGNHDKQSSALYQTYCAEVYDHPIYIKENIVLSHHPIQVNAGVLNVHGHLHGAKLDSKNHLNVSIAVANYKAVEITELYNIAARLPKDNHNFLEEWFADIQVPLFNRPDLVVFPNGRINVEASKKLRAEKFQLDEKGFVKSETLQLDETTPVINNQD